MSDFDKEAERQRLREKYEKDAERREETQRMSELLLQGATMTNKHCNQCGTPIFRYQGTEFCPNCQNKQANAAAETADAAAAKVANGEAGDAPVEASSEMTAEGTTVDEAGQSVPTPEPERDVPSEVADADGASGTGASNAQTGGSSGGTAAASEQTASTESGTGTTVEASSTAAASESAGTAGEAVSASNAAGGSMQGAREALLRAITEHARRSTATEEPERATAHLQAAREAAEALDALDR